MKISITIPIWNDDTLLENTIIYIDKIVCLESQARHQFIAFYMYDNIINDNKIHEMHRRCLILRNMHFGRMRVCEALSLIEYH